jgi:hypothetical protein
MRFEHQSLRQGLVGAWCPSLTGGSSIVPDQSGRAVHGTVSSPAYAASGSGRSIFFNGSSSKTELIATPRATFGASASLSLWVKRRIATPTVSSEIGCWCADSNSPGTVSLYPWVDGNVYMRSFRTGRVSFAPLASVNRAEWHNVCITTDGSFWRFYQSGLLANSTTAEASVNLTLFAFGQSYDSNVSNAYWFDGWMDDIRLYNRALTLAEIRLLASRRGIGLSPLPDRAAGMPRKLFVNVGGTWRDGDAYVNVGGTWKLGTPFVNAGGTWK